MFLPKPDFGQIEYDPFFYSFYFLISVFEAKMYQTAQNVAFRRVY